ncbi:MAG: hypothetical protein AB8E15_13740 [Bdellovibrionales bacterium]
MKYIMVLLLMIQLLACSSPDTENQKLPPKTSIEVDTSTEDKYLFSSKRDFSFNTEAGEYFMSSLFLSKNDDFFWGIKDSLEIIFIKDPMGNSYYYSIKFNQKAQAWKVEISTPLEYDQFIKMQSIDGWKRSYQLGDISGQKISEFFKYKGLRQIERCENTKEIELSFVESPLSFELHSELFSGFDVHLRELNLAIKIDPKGLYEGIVVSKDPLAGHYSSDFKVLDTKNLNHLSIGSSDQKSIIFGKKSEAGSMHFAFSDWCEEYYTDIIGFLAPPPNFRYDYDPRIERIVSKQLGLGVFMERKGFKSHLDLKSSRMFNFVMAMQELENAYEKNEFRNGTLKEYINEN